MHRRDVLKAATLAAGAGLAAAASPSRADIYGPRSAPAPSPALPYVAARDGTALYFKDWGTGAPVVFVHGWTLGADMWEYQMPALAGAGLRALAYDKRGCGRSGQPWGGYDYGTFADDLAALMEQRDLGGATLVAHSMGAGDAVRYLSRHGTARVARLVLVAPTTPFLLQTPDNPEGVPRAMFDGVLAALEQDRPAYLAAAARAFFGIGKPDLPVSAELLRWGVDLALQGSPHAARDMFRASFETDFRAKLRALTLPVLIIQGDADQQVPIQVSGRRTAALVAGSRLVVYEGGSHGLMFTHRERLNRDIAAFAKS
jgi:pimeloyl-ACP methyl ester carboxylesterase